MPSFPFRHPYFIIVICLFVCVLGLTSLAQMPVDMFPPINIPVVLVATFYNGMPPEQIEADVTDTFERFFTLGSGIDHMESRSMTGVSLIKIYFQPGTNANADVTQISNLGDGRLAPPSRRHPASGGFENRCFEPAGLLCSPSKDKVSTKRSFTIISSTRFEIRSRMCQALPFLRRTAASTAKSWSTSIRSSCRLTT